MSTLLLHICCGPCGFSATKFLDNKFAIKYYWYNPNIQPLTEYEKRLAVARELLSQPSFCVNSTKCDEMHGVLPKGRTTSLIVDNYDNQRWLSLVKDISYQKNKRCEMCYRVRLTKTAQKSKELKADFFSTTLLVSPHQQHDALKKICQEVAKEVGVTFYYYDGRSDFYKNLNEFKKTGLYVQKYCGCL